MLRDARYSSLKSACCMSGPFSRRTWVIGKGVSREPLPGMKLSATAVLPVTDPNAFPRVIIVDATAAIPARALRRLIRFLWSMCILPARQMPWLSCERTLESNLRQQFAVSMIGSKMRNAQPTALHDILPFVAAHDSDSLSHRLVESYRKPLSRVDHVLIRLPIGSCHMNRKAAAFHHPGI